MTTVKPGTLLSTHDMSDASRSTASAQRPPVNRCAAAGPEVVVSKAALVAAVAVVAVVLPAEAPPAVSAAELDAVSEAV